MEHSAAELLPPGASEKWRAVLGELSVEFGAGLFDLYFRGLQLEEVAGNIAVLSTLKTKRMMLTKSHNAALLSKLASVWPGIIQVEIVDRMMGIPYQSPIKEPEDAPLPPEPRKEKYVYRNRTFPPPADRMPPPVEPAAVSFERKKKERIRLIEIETLVAKKHGISVRDLLSRSRIREHVWPRQIVFYLAVLLTGRSYPEIGRNCGGRDHTTVLHSKRKVEERIREDSTFAEEIEALAEELSYATVLVTDAGRPR
jgi:chromosomal replication initiation ATPase DnaA